MALTADLARRLEDVLAGIRHASAAPVTLVAVSKLQPVAAVAELAGAGQRHFGENYVQELLRKARGLAPEHPDLVWHQLGPLQSNKVEAVARHADWLQSLDRAKLVPLLAAARRNSARAPLQLLIQVNLDDEASKHGLPPDAEAILALGAAVAAHPELCWRGLMTIPRPEQEPARRRAAFARMRRLYDEVRRHAAGLDTLSMGMSADYLEAIAEGATMVRVGTALFGPRG